MKKGNCAACEIKIDYLYKNTLMMTPTSIFFPVFFKQVVTFFTFPSFLWFPLFPYAFVFFFFFLFCFALPFRTKNAG